MATITIKELHAKTGEEVRKAGKSRSPVAVTDHGKLVAVLAAPHLYRASPRRRTLLPEYAAYLAKTGRDDVLDDLAAVRARLDTEDQVALSELARAELMGVFHRRLRERKWTQDEVQAVMRQFTKDDIGGYWSWLPLDGVIVEQSIKTFTTLPESIFLRTADCLRLDTALHHGFEEIYTHDTHQIRAAAALGLTAVQIE